MGFCVHAKLVRLNWPSRSLGTIGLTIRAPFRHGEVPKGGGDYGVSCRINKTALTGNGRKMVQDEFASSTSRNLEKKWTTRTKAHTNSREKVPGRNVMRLFAGFRWLTLVPGALGIKGHKWVHS